MMARQSYYDAACPLREHMARFRPVYYWLEYWGDWLGPAGDRDFPEISLNPIARLMMRGKNYIRATAGDVWNRDLQTLERSLGPLRNSEKAIRQRDPRHTDLYRLLYRLHNRKWSLDQISIDEGLHYKTLDSKLNTAYTVVMTNIFQHDAGMYHRSPPQWV
jgi:hypothetical protein